MRATLIQTTIYPDSFVARSVFVAEFFNSIGHHGSHSMHTETVEIYSDTINAAVMRHPGRSFPGVLIQGDTLYSMCQVADSICSTARSHIDGEAYDDLNGLRNQLWSLLSHYKVVLGEHGMPLPFSEQPLA